MESVQLVLKLEDQLSGKLKKISRDSSRLEQAVVRVQNQAVRLQQKAKQMGNTLGNAFNRARKGADGLAKKMSGLRGLAVGLGAGAATKGFIEQAASFEQTQVRLELLSRQYGEFAQVQKLVRKNAATFNQSLGESSSNFADIFARLRPLGKSLSEIQTVYQGFNAVALASGTSAQAASSAFLQLSQALGSGRLQGDEFRSISEQIPGILTLVSQEMGVTVGELKKLGSEGKITSDILINSLAKGFELNKDKIQELLAESPAARFKALKNRVDELSVSIGQTLLPAAEGTAGVLEGLIDIVQKLPPELQTLLNVGVGVGGALAAAAAGANLLGISLTSAKIKAGFLLFGKFALLAGPILGLAVAFEDARRKAKQFSDLMKSLSVSELSDGIKTTKENLQKMEKTLAAIEGSGYYRGQASDAAGLRDRIAEAVEQLDKLKKRQASVREVMSQKFTVAGIEYDANMVPINPPETVSQRIEREEREKNEPKDDKRVDMSQRMLDLNNRLRSAQEGEQARLAATLKLMVEKQRIAESELGPIQKANDLAEAYATFRAEVKQIDQQIANQARLEAEARQNALAPLHEEIALLEGKLAGKEDEVLIEQEIEKIKLRAKGLSEQEIRDLIEQRNLLRDKVEEAERLEQIYDQIGNTISKGIVDSLTQAKSVSEALGNVLNNIADQLITLGVNTLLKGTGLDIFSNLKGFANGGSPPVGKPSIVGEKGPELFVPKSAGTIFPNGTPMGGSNIVVNVDASGSSVEGDSNQAAQLGKMLGAAVQAELVKQKRPGGLLAT